MRSADISLGIADRHQLPQWAPIDQSFVLRNLNAFVMTETELNVIAALAIIGDRSKPKTGNSTPAAIGTPTML